jgi:hypothetical protein
VKLYSGVLFGMLLVACSGGDSGDDDATGDADASTQPPAETYEIAWGPITVPSGTENVQCVNVRLGNDVPVKIRQITNVLGDVSTRPRSTRRRATATRSRAWSTPRPVCR